MQNNLNEQLEWLSKNFEEALYSGFQYAPTASVNIERPVRFNFDNQKRTNSRNAALCSLGDIGYMELQEFRNTSTEEAVDESVAISDTAFLDFDLDGMVSIFALLELLSFSCY